MSCSMGIPHSNNQNDDIFEIGELMVWTGTHGLLQLADSNGTLVMRLILLAKINNLLIFNSFHSKSPGWHLLGRRGQSEGSGAQVTKISKSVKRSILVSGFSGKWSLTEKASGGSQCWAQTIHTRLRLHLALRLHKRCPGSGDGEYFFEGSLF